MARTAYNSVLDAGMLLHRCARCARDLDRHGKLCRSCNNKQLTKTILGTAAFLELGLALVLALKPLKLPSITSEDQAAITAPPPVSKAAQLTPQGPSGWMYFDSADPLIGDVTHHARLLGNAVAAKATAPNQQMTTGVLELSSSQHYGRQVVVSFPRVRTACHANPCSVRAVFDEQPAQSVAFSDVSEGESTILMLTDYDKMTSSMAHAQSLTIVASMGTEKDTVLSFSVSGFKMQMAQAQRAYPVRVVVNTARTRAAG